MLQKKIIITIDDSDDIIIKNNDVIKITIKSDNNVITGKEILKSLDLEKNDVLEILALDETLEKHPKYKVTKMIYELYKDIIDGINSYKEEYDIVVDDMDIGKKQ